jgi:hypothetical protein
VGYYQGRPLHLLDEMGYGKGLARACSPKQCLKLIAFIYSLGQLPYGLRLVSPRNVFGYNLELPHVFSFLVNISEKFVI